jgi:hypothetical protein
METDVLCLREKLTRQAALQSQDEKATAELSQHCNDAERFLSKPIG